MSKSGNNPFAKNGDKNPKPTPTPRPGIVIVNEGTIKGLANIKKEQ